MFLGGEKITGEGLVIVLNKLTLLGIFYCIFSLSRGVGVLFQVSLQKYKYMNFLGLVALLSCLLVCFS